MTAAAVAGVVAFGLLAQACANKAIPGAADRLEQFEDDPVVKFRAPGTKLVKDSKESGVVLWGGTETETRLDQVFSMTGDAAATVDAYRVEAEAAGWSLTFEGCSRDQQATGRAYKRSFDGHSATLSIRAELGSAPESSRDKDTLTVSIVLGGDDTVVYVGQHRTGLDCLAGLDPKSPEMKQPETDRITPEALCAAVNIDDLPAVQERLPYGNPDDGYPSTCNFFGGLNVGHLFTVGEAGQSLAYYQDVADDAAPPPVGRRFTFTGFDDAGIWVMSSRGPLVVTSRYSTAGQYGLSPERLERIADDLAAL